MNHQADDGDDQSCAGRMMADGGCLVQAGSEQPAHGPYVSCARHPPISESPRAPPAEACPFPWPLRTPLQQPRSRLSGS